MFQQTLNLAGIRHCKRLMFAQRTCDTKISVQSNRADVHRVSSAAMALTEDVIIQPSAKRMPPTTASDAPNNHICQGEIIEKL